MKHAVLPSKIWGPCSEIWPDFAKSGCREKSEIWFFPLSFSGLRASFQISERGLQNLLQNLENLNEISDLRQISDFRKSTPKGVGGLPRKGGGPPPTPGQSARAEVLARDQSDDGGRYRQASTAVVFHPSSQPEKETTHG